MSATNAAMDALLKETVPILFRYLRVPDKAAQGTSSTPRLSPDLPYQLICETTQPFPNLLRWPNIHLEVNFQSSIYLAKLFEQNKADLIKASGSTCTECAGSPALILYLMSYRDGMAKAYVVTLCDRDACMEKYQRLETFKELFHFLWTPIIGVYPYVADGKYQCRGCGKACTQVKKSIFAVKEPSAALRIFNYACCRSVKCEAKTEDLKFKDLKKYKTAKYGTANSKTPVEGVCQGCGKKGVTLKCSKCRKVYYCGKECQKMDWITGHKHVCREAGNDEAEAKSKHDGDDEDGNVARKWGYLQNLYSSCMAQGPGTA